MRSGSVPRLRDEQDFPPERLVQGIWFHQRLRREQLTTLDGQRLRVLHPGYLNLEGGPDFRQAVLQFADGEVRTGDIEVDLRASGWRGHGHDRNPAFAGVILHVVWESEKPAGIEFPTLQLKTFLDAPLGELGLWLSGDVAPPWPDFLRGKCCAPLKSLERGQVLDLLTQAAGVRLHSKAAEIQARARAAGWEQALWEKLFRALGYKHNSWPMQCLGELRPRWGNPVPESPVLEARLMGISGLLPAELPRSEPGTDHYFRKIWDAWWRERDAFADCLLPSRVWRLHGIRPANHPQRRLALASRWASGRSQLPEQLERWCTEELAPSEWSRRLYEILNAEADDFWSWHWTFRSRRLPRAQPLLGPARLTDIAVNVVLPWLHARAESGDGRLGEAVRRRYFEWGPAEDNSVLKRARERLLGTSSKTLFKAAAAQQGLLQIVRDFCDNSNSVCDRCKLPDLVRQMPLEMR